MRQDGPELTLGQMRAQGMRWIDMLCLCGHEETKDVDDLPDRLSVSDLRERLRCARCGARPRQTRPHSAASPLRRPSRFPAP